MPSAFISGTVTVGGKPCPDAAIHIARIPTSSKDGSYIAVVHRAGTYAVTARAPGCCPLVVKAAVSKLDGKARIVNFKLKPCKG